MQRIRGLLMILAVSCLGEYLKALLPLPVPASIYGLVILFGLLLSGAVKLGQVEGAADFLIEIMPVLFIPAGVGLMASWPVLAPIAVPVLVMIFLTTVLVMIVTGLVTDRLTGKEEGHE